MFTENIEVKQETLDDIQVSCGIIPETNILIAGLGGVGSRLVGPLAKTFPEANLLLVDFDHVEEKNVERQNFSRADVGKSKVAAIKERPGIRWLSALEARITPANIDDILDGFGAGDAVVSCVDNARTRLLLAEGAIERECLFINCANEDLEAIAWAMPDMDKNTVERRVKGIRQQVAATDEEEGCMALELKQTAMANDMAASFALSLLCVWDTSLGAGRAYLPFQITRSRMGMVSTLYYKAEL